MAKKSKLLRLLSKRIVEGLRPSKEITSPFPLLRGRGIKGDRVAT